MLAKTQIGKFARAILTPDGRYYYPRCVFVGFSIGFGIITFGVKFQVENAERKISLMRTLTRNGLEGSLVASNEVFFCIFLLIQI